MSAIALLPRLKAVYVEQGFSHYVPGVNEFTAAMLILKAMIDHKMDAQLEVRMALGAGSLPPDAPVFGTVEGDWPNPYSISDRWRDVVKNRKLSKVTFHTLRHNHASALISAGRDVVSVSKRLGHASPALTLSVYSHLFITMTMARRRR